MKTSSINPKRPYFKGFPVQDNEEGQGERRKKPLERTGKPLVPTWMFIVLGFLMPILIIIFIICPVAGSLLTISGMKGMQATRYFGDNRQGQAQ